MPIDAKHHASRAPVRITRYALVTPLALALMACGSSSPDSASGGASSNSGSAAADDSDASAASISGGNANDDGGSVAYFGAASDGSADGGNACAQLNIGILGLPGADSSSSFQDWLTKSGTSVTSLQTTTDDPLTAAELAPFDVVVLDLLQRDYTAAEAAIFADWVQKGGGVASMSGFANDDSIDFRANSLLAPLGVGYQGPIGDGPITQFATHPITAGLSSVTFIGGYPVGDLGGAASTRTPLAFSPGTTTPVSYAVSMGAGHAFVWGDEWISFDSEWSSIPEIKQLWVQVFGWIAPHTACAIQPPK